MIRILFLLSVFLVSGSTFAAQNLGPNPIIGGVPVSCGGNVTIVAPVNDIAKAMPGRIVLNPAFFQLPPVVQLFIYAHECGHHVVGLNEAAADCWAIKTGRNQGWLPPQGANLVGAFFINTPGDWTHAPGPYRVQQMAACYNTP